MDRDQLVIATISLARNEAEEALLKQSLQVLNNMGFRVFCTDGGSGENFVHFLHSLSNFTIVPLQQPGVFYQAKASLDAAYQSGAAFIFYTEPDKLYFFQNGVSSLLESNLDKHEDGILLAARNVASFQTFPAFQQMTETTINNCLKEITTIDCDFTYGPFCMNRNLLPALFPISEDLGWGWRPFVFATAQKKRLGIRFIQGDFACPPEQRNDNAKERVYRMKQLYQNIQGIVAVQSTI